uniref:Endonuclease/exonuclease/phosphatase domain-containing protein n=1 Tax=Paramoeba aestuarina TaxID=180227 RepID=A0A7S4JMM5_9EUKA|eukprot:CAMPEP_0201509874 /NCGR_PEP_ID=MMETSP0161_2-20130828/2802_1 /ASSEMBLY_ACC=CAM_ASM_000251 /TAXON_ID=180227 /ORGANISM="Neoparamoeba aestuarina, Strain SoJaBio B1-5/56/2" /LENGTH=326 /DNA_ID=CAMNT_0047904963 /DNA_START=91 /DNA_END=1071 /DNA_ORIENTATION=-
MADTEDTEMTDKFSDLLHREWKTFPSSSSSSSSPPFRIMYFNLLASGLGDDQFPDRVDVVRKEKRFPLALREIERWNCDIVCLCECNHFEDFWIKEMTKLGYTQHVRLPKMFSPCEYFGAPPDGSAVFFRPRFNLVNDLSFYFFDKKPMILVVVKDVEGGEGKELAIGVTHLKAFEKNYETRGKEVKEGLGRMEFLAGKRDPKEVPIIFGGDFNEGEGGVVERAVKASKLGLKSSHDTHHPVYTAMDLKATWNVRNKVPGCSPGAFRGLLDYVFYTQEKFNLIGIAEEPNFDDLLTLHKEGKDALGIPNSRYPSDHIAQVCEFQWK